MLEWIRRRWAEDEQMDSDSAKFFANFVDDTERYPEGAFRTILKVSYKLSREDGDAWANVAYKYVIAQNPWVVSRSELARMSAQYFQGLDGFRFTQVDDGAIWSKEISEWSSVDVDSSICNL
ncbi:unnamed protein product [Symbiodinium sp. CCMP2592]|nr:unnamed protein product [Symbiodinium sp. CCMP2592]